MKGFTNKQPKIVAACVGVLTRALRYYISVLLVNSEFLWVVIIKFIF